MVIFRSVRGPFGRKTDKILNQIQWSFITILGDHTVAHYTLIYDCDDTKLYPVNSGINHVGFSAKRFYPTDKYPVVRPELFIDPDQPVITGESVTKVLTQKLADEDIALITSARILGRLL